MALRKTILLDLDANGISDARKGFNWAMGALHNRTRPACTLVFQSGIVCLHQASGNGIAVKVAIQCRACFCLC